MGYHLRIKICGVTNEIDAQEAARLGANAIGLNFYPQSPRCVNPLTANFILRDLPLFTEAVGVFVNESFRDIFVRLQTHMRIRTIQWHGQTREVSNIYPYHLIAAFSVQDANSLTAIRRYLDTCKMVGSLPSAVLVDAHVAGEYGGTGQTAPWKLLATFRPGIPVILAGGLTPENVAEAVRIVQPWGVDVASGVEHHPGQKDPEKMRRFLDAAREAAAKVSA
jgi:phosphoribosylanthranilate isomerase